MSRRDPGPRPSDDETAGKGSACPDWQEPEAGFRPAAYWFWPRLPSDDEMRAQLRDFRDRGLSTILIQARLGLPLAEYLSPAWLAAYSRAVEIMGELGLSAGLYDDYNWISGHAAGRTVAGAEHLRERMLFWASGESAEGEISGIRATLAASLGPEIAGWLYEGGQPRFDGWEVVAALLHPAGSGAATEVTGAVEIVGTGPTTCRFRLRRPLPAGQRLSVFVAARCANARGINYLMPEAGARFVTQGLAPYARALGPALGAVVRFLFFDQPAPGFYRWDQMTGAPGNALAYAPALRARIEALGGGSFAQHLLALIADQGATTAGLRQAFYRAYADQMHRAFLGPLRDFCAAHGLAMTGHEVLPHVGGFALNGGFSSIDPRVAPAVDFFGLDRWRDETAVDVNNLAPQLAPLMGDGIARAAGRRGCLAELYFTATRTERRAAGMWELTPADLRAQMIRCHLLGARQMILHAVGLEAGHARDAALFANPRFDFAPVLNFEPWWPHMRAISDETARLSAFLAGAGQGARVALLYPRATAWVEGPRHAHAQTFGAVAQGLYELGHACLIVDEEGLRGAQTGKTGVRVHGAPVAALVLPDAALLESAGTAQAIARMQAAGCALWIAGEGPAAALDGPATLTADRVLRAAPETEDVHAALATLALPGPRVAAGPAVRATCPGRDAGGWWRLVLFNEGGAEARAAISLPTGLAYERIDLAGGLAAGSGSAAELRLTLAPQELVALRLIESGAPADPPEDRRGAPAWRQLTGGWTLSIGGASHPVVVTGGWQRQGFARFSGVGVYETGITLDRAAGAVLRLPGLACAAEVFVDGRRAGATCHPPFAVALGDLAAGRHRLRIEVANTAANAFYADTPYAGAQWPDASGLTAPPEIALFPPNSEKGAEP